MPCPYCGRPAGAWRALHEHLVTAHADRVVVDADDGTAPVFLVSCPECPWTFRQAQGARRGPDHLAVHHREVALVAFDQLMMHWAEEHVEAEEASMGGAGGDSERV